MNIKLHDSDTHEWDRVNGDSFLEVFEAKLRTDIAGIEVTFAMADLWASATGTVKRSSSALDALIPDPNQMPGHCWNCGSYLLVLEPDPTMQGVTDRLRCEVCNENN